MVLTHPAGSNLARLNRNAAFVVDDLVLSARKWKQTKECEMIRRRLHAAYQPRFEISIMPTQFPACFFPADPLPPSWQKGDTSFNTVNVGIRRHQIFQQFYSATDPLMLVSPNVSLKENFALELDDGINFLQNNPKLGLISFQPQHDTKNAQLSGHLYLFIFPQNKKQHVP